jgi:hypothetical protein
VESSQDREKERKGESAPRKQGRLSVDLPYGRSEILGPGIHQYIYEHILKFTTLQIQHLRTEIFEYVVYPDMMIHVLGQEYIYQYTVHVNLLSADQPFWT